MKIDANVNIPTFPLLPIKRALALLKPRVLEEFKRCENER
jgi:hypothetical protein